MNRLQLAIFLSMYIVMTFLTHWLGYRAVIRFFYIDSTAVIWWLRFGFTFFAISFLLSSAISFRFNNIFTRIYYIGAVTWIGFFFFLLISALVAWIIYFFMRWFGSEVDVSIIGQLLLLLGLVVSFYGIWNADTPRISLQEIKIKNLPHAWVGKRIIFVSDIHLGQVRGVGYAEKISREIRFLDPDIVLIGGDLFDGVAGDLHKLVKPFGKINAPLGTYFILGNHEEFRDNKPFLKAVESVGMHALVDEKISLHGVDLVGVDYKTGKNKTALQELYENLNIDRTRPNILMIHEPTGLELSSSSGFDLQLSGHTHRGQVSIFEIFTNMVYKGYSYGLKKYNHMQVYTSSGVGTWGPPFRIGTESEIVYIKLVNQ
jgi:hypothetical protein